MAPDRLAHGAAVARAILQRQSQLPRRFADRRAGRESERRVGGPKRIRQRRLRDADGSRNDSVDSNLFPTRSEGAILRGGVISQVVSDSSILPQRAWGHNNLAQMLDW